MIELDFDDRLLRGLRRYVRLVGKALGLSGECWCVQGDRPACAYIAVDGRLRGHPDRDVALLWDEEHGWSAAIETNSGEDLMVVAYMGQNVLPSPRAVAAWTRTLFDHGETAARPEAPPRFPETSDLLHRLDTYTIPMSVPAAGVR
jgi:hypothetical protein